MLWTTLRVLREHDACLPRYRHLREGLPSKFGQDTPIPLLHILCINGLDDTLWALSAVHPDCNTERDTVSRLMAADFAEEVLPVFESHKPGNNVLRETLATARRFARGQATHEELGAVKDSAKDATYVPAKAAYNAARAAYTAAGGPLPEAYNAAYNAARYAARASAIVAAHDTSATAHDAAWNVAWDAARVAQAQIVFEYLSGRRG